MPQDEEAALLKESIAEIDKCKDELVGEFTAKMQSAFAEVFHALTGMTATLFHDVEHEELKCCVGMCFFFGFWDRFVSPL